MEVWLREEGVCGSMIERGGCVCGSMTERGGCVWKYD